MAKTPAWQRKEGKNPKGGLNAKGRASYNKANPGKPGLKAPQPEGGPRRDSFCARMKGMKKGGKVKKMAKGGTTRDEDKGVVDRALGTKFGFSKGGSVASKRADGCATKGKTKGRFV